MDVITYTYWEFKLIHVSKWDFEVNFDIYFQTKNVTLPIHSVAVSLVIFQFFDTNIFFISNIIKIINQWKNIGYVFKLKIIKMKKYWKPWDTIQLLYTYSFKCHYKIWNT